MSLGRCPPARTASARLHADTNGTASTAANTFTVSVKPGQQTLTLTGWNHDASSSGRARRHRATCVNMGGWAFYEYGLTGGTKGLAADLRPSTNRTFASSATRPSRFQFAPYAGSNAVFLSGPGSVTLTLVNPAKFSRAPVSGDGTHHELVRPSNFADGSSTATGTVGLDREPRSVRPVPDFVRAEKHDRRFYTGYLWMSTRLPLPVPDQAKTCIHAFTTLSAGDRQLVFSP